MRGLGRAIFGIIAATLLLSCAGCGEEKIISEDFERGNYGNFFVNPIMKTDKGFYYGQGAFKELSLHYYDSKNGKNMFLCNKPECRHDGNEFCAATSDKYRTMGAVMYGDSIYINVLEETETSYVYKLLRASLDGASLSEVVTYFEIDNVDIHPILYGDMSRAMAIHRNKAFLPYRLTNDVNSEVGICGTAIYDMDTGEVTYLGDKAFAGWDNNFMGCGEYMYFVTSQKYKTELYRYCYTDGSVEKVALERNFKGKYAIYDDNTIFYVRGQGDLFIRKLDTKENIAVKTDEWNGYMLEIPEEKGGGIAMHTHARIESILSDGEYVYIPENFSLDSYSYPLYIIYYDSEATGERVEITKDYIEVTILDSEGNYVNEVRVRSKDLLGYNAYFTLHFTEDAVYMQTSVMVYECSKADFIAGNANFKEAYPLDIDIVSRKEKAQ